MSIDAAPSQQRPFATLTPANAIARLALSDAYTALTAGRQSEYSPALDRMSIEPQQIYDRDVLRFRLEADRQAASRDATSSDADNSGSLTEPDTETETELRQLGMIWTGHYVMALTPPLHDSSRGFAAGKGPLEGRPVDLALCTKAFARKHGITLSTPHAYFDFSQDRSFYIVGRSNSPSAQLAVNGEAVTRQMFHLNQRSMRVRFDKLEYVFQWTDFADTVAFNNGRERYVVEEHKGQRAVDNMMPTPLTDVRTMGKWTLGRALGAGGLGRVFFASSSAGEMAAMKTMERNSRNHRAVDTEVRLCREMTEFVNGLDYDNRERIVRVVQVVYSDGEVFLPDRPFDTVALALRPLTPETLSALARGRTDMDGAKGISLSTAATFRDALVSLKCMHDGNWIHRDLKPPNIGLIGTPRRSVLLDVGGAAQIPPAGKLRSLPGTVGTVGYLAPELELAAYDAAVDVWAMGVMLYELTYGYHPWRLTLNPWREGSTYEELRPTFQERYETAIARMQRDFNAARQSPTAGFVHLGSLFVEMVRFPWAANNNGPRPGIDNVLQHPAWGPLLPDMREAKRQRRST